MKNRKAFLILLMASLLLTSGCTSSKTDAGSADNKTESPTETEESSAIDSAETEASETASEEAYSFWDKAGNPADSDNVYRLFPDSFEGIFYTDAYAMGSHLLLIEKDPNDIIYGEEFDIDSASESYTVFSLYDPSTDQLLRSLSVSSRDYDSYAVTNSHFYLLNCSGNQLSVYDRDLQLSATYDISSLSQGYSGELYFLPEEKIFWNTYFVDGYIRKYAPESDQLDILDLSLYAASLVDISESGRYLLIAGVAEDTMRENLLIYDTKEAATVSIIEGNYFNYELSDHGLFARSSSGPYRWIYLPMDGEPVRFTMDGLEKITFTDSDHFIARVDSGYYYCNAQGDILSTFSCEESSYANSDPIYLPEEECIVFLEYESSYTSDGNFREITDTHSHFLVLDCRDAFSDSDNLFALQDETEGSYDWGDLKEVNQMAEQLEEKYGVEIFFDQEVPDSLGSYLLTPETDPAILSASMELLKKVLSCYPDDFFTQLRVRNIEGVNFHLVRSLTTMNSNSIDAPGGLVTEADNKLHMVLSCDAKGQWISTINHEFSHMIDRRLDYLYYYRDDSLFNEADWLALNPDSFHYLYSYLDYYGNPLYDENSEYFYDAYGITYPTEDRAQVFAASMECYIEGSSPDFYFYEGSPLRDKLSWFCAAIRDGFDTTGWPEVMPWEACLQE